MKSIRRKGNEFNLVSIRKESMSGVLKGWFSKSIRKILNKLKRRDVQKLILFIVI